MRYWLTGRARINDLLYGQGSFFLEGPNCEILAWWDIANQNRGFTSSLRLKAISI